MSGSSGDHRNRGVAMDVAVRTVDYHTGGRTLPDRAGAAGGIAGSDGRRAEGPRPGRSRGAAPSPAAVLGAARARRHVRGLIVPPDDAGAALGVLFWHKDGFSTACGHGTIALGRWAVDAGLVDGRPRRRDRRRGRRPVGARDGARAHPGGRVRRWTSSTCRAIRSRGVPVTTRRGTVAVDLAFGGAIYAVVAAADLGLAVEPAHLPELIALGREIKHALDGSEHARHPGDDRLSGVYGTILVDDLGVTRRRLAAPAQRHHLRRRRGGPLPVRLGHVCPARPCSTTRGRCARGRPWRTTRSSGPGSWPGWPAGRRFTGGRPCYRS